MSRYVYLFSDLDDAQASVGGDWSAVRRLLGGKGANLAEMCKLGLPVPPGFTITTDVCTAYYANNRTYPSNLKAEVNGALG